MPSPRKSRVYTISLPPDLAKDAEEIAQQESRTMSELFREAFRTYRSERAVKALQEAASIGTGPNPQGYTEQDLPRLLKEVRAELKAERARKVRAAG